MRGNWPPLPVRALEYDTQGSRDPWPVPMRAIGFVLLIIGVVEALSQGYALIASVAGWSDGFYMRGNYSRVPSPYLLMGLSVGACVSGIVATVGGIGCALRRPWSRWTLLTYAMLQIAGRLTHSGTWMWYYYTLRPRAGLDGLTLLASQIGGAIISIALPAIVVILVRERRLWGSQAGWQ